MKNEEIVKSGKLKIKQLLDMGVFVLPSDDEMEEIRPMAETARADRALGGAPKGSTRRWCS